MPQQLVTGPEGGTEPRRVAVVQQRGRRREPPQQPRLLGRERGAERRHHLLHAGKHQPEDVEVPLDQDDGLGLSDGGLRLMQVVELPSLVEDRRLGGVEVLGLARSEQPPAEPDDPAAQVVDREQQAVPEPRNHLAVVAHGAQAGLEHHRLLPAQLLHRREEALPGRREAEPVLARDVQGDLSSLEVLSGIRAIGRLEEPAGEPVLRHRDRLEERLPGVGAGARRAFGNHDPSAACRFAHRRRVVHSEPLHQPGEDVARCVTDEAVVAVLLGDHGEVAVGAAVERTRAPVIGAGALELDRLPDEAYQVGALPDLIYRLVGNHAHAENSTMVTPVPP